jgi:hypothetical protein
MRITALTTALVIVLVAFASAQTAQSDEQQIRALIAKNDAGQSDDSLATKDRIFWSGAYKRPFISPARGEEIPDADRVSLRKPDSQRITTTPVRIEVAKSGDLAYEFSNGTLSYETKDGRKVSFPNSILRVWRKEGGQWKVAALFSQPHYEEPAKK